MSQGGAVIVGAAIGATAAVLGSLVTAWLVAHSARQARRSSSYVDFIAAIGLVALTGQGARALHETGTTFEPRPVDPLAIIDSSVVISSRSTALRPRFESWAAKRRSL